MLADLRGADGDSVEEFLDLGQPCAAGDQRADAVAGQAVGLGEGIEVDERVMPIGVAEQRVWRAGAAVKIAG